MEVRWKEARQRVQLGAFVCLVPQLGTGVHKQYTHTQGQKDLFFSSFPLVGTWNWHLHLECLARRSPWEPVPCTVLSGPGSYGIAGSILFPLACRLSEGF